MFPRSEGLLRKWWDLRQAENITQNQVPKAQMPYTEGCWKNFPGRETLSRNLSGQVLFSIIGFRMENDAKLIDTD